MQEIGDQLVLNKGVRRAINHHKKGDCCCFCLSTRIGVYIIGIGMCIGLLEEYAAPNYIRMALKIAALVPFFMMLYKDCAFHRQLYLYLFCLTVPAIAIVNLVAYQNILVNNVAFAAQFCWLSQKFMAESQEEREAREECEDNGDENDDCEAGRDQCPALPGGMLKALFIITPLVVIINIHFAFVLYTHWRNARLPENQGGCQDPDGPDHQEFHDED